MQQIFYTFLILCICGNLQAQTISGKVQTASDAPIVGATVNILNTDKTTVTSSDGKFTITNLAAGNYRLSISSVGYAAQVKNVSVAKGNTSAINIVLTEQGKQLEEVVVSSEKREETLQRTPVAVSVLNAQQVRNYRIWDVRDLTAVVPDLFVIEHAGSTGANFVNVRGVMGFTPEQSVATYIDGVYQYDYFSAPGQYLDIERIEVLRGPQGTLYGRNALSGVVNILTKKPANTTNGQVELNNGNYGQQRYSAAINWPLLKDKLFATAAVMYSQRGAVFKNGGKDYDKQYGQAFNAGIKYIATGRLSFDLNAKGNFAKDHGAYPWQNVTNIDSLLKSAGAYNVAFSNPNIEQRSNLNTALTVRYSADRFNVISISAYNRYHQNYPGNYDADFSAADVFSGNATYLRGQNNFSQEVRLSSKENGAKLDWLGGVYAFSQDYEKKSSFNYGVDATTIDPNAPFSLVTFNPVNNKGVSVFGQLGYALSSKWNVTAGGRMDNENRTLSQYVDSVKDNISTRVAPANTYNNSYSKFTPKIAFNYRATETQMFYASYAKGYRVGGFNAGQPKDRIVYDPENSDNFETGYKSTFLNNKLRFNAAAFYLYLKGHQVSTTNDGINYYYLNLGNYKNAGIETELTALVVKGLEAQWNFSYTKGRFTKLRLFDNATATTKDYGGNKIIFAPPVTSMLALQYTYQLQNNKAGLALFARGEWRYVGKYYFDYYNATKQDAYGLLNARWGLTATKFDVGFWIRNLMNKRYITYGNQSPSFPLYMMSNPRMWGLTVTGKF